MNTTFCLIKPDAIERGLAGEIMSRFEKRFLRLGGLSMRHKLAAWCLGHYVHLSDKPFYPDLVAFMTAAPLIGFTLTGPNAVEVVRSLVGPTDSLKAPPGTIRGDFGYYPVMFNCVHASDSIDRAKVEFELFNDPTTDRA